MQSDVALILLLAFVATPTEVGAQFQVPAEVIPVQTDDGIDPINLIWTGYAPAWWVASNLLGWSDTSQCSTPKTLQGKNYNLTLEHVDGGGFTCLGPRYHVRIWDMGSDPKLGSWSIGAVHHEYLDCSSFCRHVVDSWENAEMSIRSVFADSSHMLLVSNRTVDIPRYYQDVFDDGNATIIEMKRPDAYPVVFFQTGLPAGTLWSATLDGMTKTSTSSEISFWKPKGTYSLEVQNPLEESNSVRYVVSQVPTHVVVNGGAWRTQVDYHMQYYLAVIIVPYGSGAIGPTGGWYDAGSSVTLTAHAQPGYEFLTWEGDGTGSYDGTENPVTIVLNGPMNQTERFAQSTVPPSKGPQVNNEPETILGFGPYMFYILGAVLITLAAYAGIALRKKEGPRNNTEAVSFFRGT